MQSNSRSPTRTRLLSSLVFYLSLQASQLPVLHLRLRLSLPFSSVIQLSSVIRILQSSISNFDFEALYFSSLQLHYITTTT